MECFETNGKFFVSVSGGYRNNDRISGETREYREMPTPVKKWRKSKDSAYGTSHKRFTQFKIGKLQEYFTIVNYSWSPSHGYSWEEHWEQFADEAAAPPSLGKAWKWADQEGWVEIAHPMTE